MSAVAQPIDVGVDLTPEGGQLARLAEVILTGWRVPEAEAQRIVRSVEMLLGELVRRCARPARVRMELSQAWPVVTLVMACADVLAVEYFDVSGYLLALPAEAVR